MGTAENGSEDDSANEVAPAGQAELADEEAGQADEGARPVSEGTGPDEEAGLDQGAGQADEGAGAVSEEAGAVSEGAGLAGDPGGEARRASGGAPPPVDPAAELSRAALEGLARRYAASRGLAWAGEGALAWRDPGPWFLSSLDVGRSFGLVRGGIGNGREGELWYAEEAVRGPGGSRERWIVARYEIGQARRTGAISCAVRRGHNLPVLGGLLQDGTLPRGLREAPTGDELFDQRYVVGAADGDLAEGEPALADRLFTAEFTGWLLGQPYGQHGADATRFQLQGGLACVYAAGWPGTAQELDAFCGRAARIAAEVERVTREASPLASPE